MFHVKHIALVAALAGSVAGCSQASFDLLNANLDRFDAAVERIDASIARTSPKLWAKCQEAQSVGTKLQPFATNLNRTAGAGLAIVNDALRAGCQTPPTDIAGTIASVVSAIDSGYAAYLKAKSGA